MNCMYNPQENIKNYDMSLSWMYKVLKGKNINVYPIYHIFTKNSFLSKSVKDFLF